MSGELARGSAAPHPDERGTPGILTGNARIKRDFDRIKKHREEKALIGLSEREIFAALKSDGYNPKALRFLLTLDKMKDREQFDDDTDTYRIALGMAVAAVKSGELSLREAGRKFGVSKSVIHREISVPQVSPEGDAGCGEEINAKAKQGSVLPPPDASKGITPDFTLANAIAEQERRERAEAKAKRDARRAELAAMLKPTTNAEWDAVAADLPPFLKATRAEAQT